MDAFGREPPERGQTAGALIVGLATAAVVLTAGWWLLLLSFLPGFDKSSVGKELLVSLPALLVAAVSLITARRYRDTGRGAALAIFGSVVSLLLLGVGWASANPT
jgi:hypothetical protein